LNYIGIHYQYDEVYYKYTQMHWKKDLNTLVSFKIHLSIIKNTLSSVLIYIHIPFKYITIPSKNLTYFWYILQYHYYTPISFHILPYTSIYIESVMKPLYSAPFCLVTNTIFEIVLAPHYSTKMSCTCHNIFVGIQKSSIFHKFHTSY
jgi:hypothetical protein